MQFYDFPHRNSTDKILNYVVLEITVLDVFVRLPDSCKVLLFILADSFAVIFCATTTPTPAPAPNNIKNNNAIEIVFIVFRHRMWFLYFLGVLVMQRMSNFFVR